MQAEHSNTTLFQFQVPGLPEIGLAVALIEVLEVSTLPAATPVPLAPAQISGLSQWRDSVITVINMAKALGGDSPDVSENEDAPFYIIAQVVNGRSRETVAWPILPGSNIIEPPAQVPVTSPPNHINPELIRATIQHNTNTLILLNLDPLFPQEKPL
ncbi:MAG: chemotaxis protein CheW [Anaerolineae bacterium]|nr:chemotaxis protein CheW [Anaerolineae bacterium]